MKNQRHTEKRWMPGSWERILVTALLVGAFVGTLILVSGCAVVPRRRRSRVVIVTDVAGGVDAVYVKKAPPKARVEVRPARPGKAAVWVQGHWQWSGRKYVWKKGHWNTRPGGKTWAPGHWEKRPRGHVWVKGHWR